MSDLFADLSAAIRSRLATDAFFATAPGIPVILEDRMELGSELAERIGKLGACVVVGEPSVTAQGNRMFDVSFVLSIFERPLINRAVTGSRQSGHDIAIAAWGLLGSWRLNDGWSPMRIRRLEPMRLDKPPMVRELEIVTSAVITDNGADPGGGGGPAVDPSGYYTKSEIDSLFLRKTDVADWAKSPAKPGYSFAEITGEMEFERLIVKEKTSMDRVPIYVIGTDGDYTFKFDDKL